MFKNFFLILSVVAAIMITTSCNNYISLSCTEIYRQDGLKNGDAKFYKEDLIGTNIRNSFTLIDFKNNKKTKFDNVNVNWFSVEKNSKTIVYSNFDGQIGILRLDDKLNIEENSIIMTSELLPIDPSITEKDGTYYITVTFVNGVVNNADIDKENGLYTLALYRTDNLSDWKFVENIIEDRHNIEDVITCFVGNRLYAFYEREEYDKGNSSLEGVYSDDCGISWSEPEVFCKADADNELGNVEYKNDRFTVYYSSDVNNKDMSYDGGEIFVKHLDKELKAADEAEIINGCSGVLLYDTEKYGKRTLFLCTEKYITAGNFVLYETE